MKFEIKAYNLQEIGQRQNQEDSLYPALGQSTNNDRLFILCDGMGGHEKGEVASATVCEVMSKTILSMWKPSEPLTDEIFEKALATAYDALDVKDNGEERKMGTTMTFVCLHSEGATVAHIGDSRVYQLRPAKDGNSAKIVFRTQDHSLVNDLVKIGEITEEEAKHHPQKNVITRAMQPCQEHRAKADIAHLTDIQPGDYFYMCSDGMLEEATDENILNIITKPDATNEQKIEILRGATDENKDNHTAHLIYIYKVEGTVVPPTVKDAEQTGPKGTFITPEFDAPRTAIGTKQPLVQKKKRSNNILTIGVLIIAAIAVTCIFFLKFGKDNSPKSESKDIVNKDSINHVASPHEELETKEPATSIVPIQTVKHDSTSKTSPKEQFRLQPKQTKVNEMQIKENSKQDANNKKETKKVDKD